jgi:hypothetical protein
MRLGIVFILLDVEFEVGVALLGEVGDQVDWRKVRNRLTIFHK